MEKASEIVVVVQQIEGITDPHRCHGLHNGVAIETAMAKTRMTDMATKIASAGKTTARPVELRGRDIIH